MLEEIKLGILSRKNFELWYYVHFGLKNWLEIKLGFFNKLVFLEKYQNHSILAYVVRFKAINIGIILQYPHFNIV